MFGDLDFERILGGFGEGFGRGFGKGLGLFGMILKGLGAFCALLELFARFCMYFQIFVALLPFLTSQAKPSHVSHFLASGCMLPLLK